MQVQKYEKHTDYKKSLIKNSHVVSDVKALALVG